MLDGGVLPPLTSGSSPPPPAQSGGFGVGVGVMDGSRRGVVDAGRKGSWFMDGSRTGKAGHAGDEYLDLSRRAGGLDASVRGGLSAAPIAR